MNSETPQVDHGEAAPAASRPNHYRDGRAFEYRVRNDLRERGFVVLRTAGSKSKIDLVAIREGIQLFIQCKRSGLLPTAEWNALVELAQMVRAVPVLAVGGRGERYWQLTAPKTKRGQRPMTPMDIQGE